MPIQVACGGCGKRFKAPDHGAGKRVPCPACRTTIAIPAAAEDEEDEGELRLAAAEPSAAHVLAKETLARQIAARRAAHQAEQEQADPERVERIERAAVAVAKDLRSTPAAIEPATIAATATSNAPARKAWVPPTRSATPKWLRHLHWSLALATIPLAVSVFSPKESPQQLLDRLARSFETADVAKQPAGSEPGNAAPAVGAPAEEQLAAGEEHGDVTLDGLLALLPGHKLRGALLSRDSRLHWLFAGVSAAAYLTFCCFLAADRSARPLHLLALGLFTATGGVLLLLFVQMAAGFGSLRLRGPAAIIMLVLLLIGLSYRAALDPEIGLVGSFFGFTFGVGLCEEVCKALPLLFFYRIGIQQNWRGAFLWGLASGAGFGVSEAVMYSQDFYNGISGPGIYLVRYISCVALHAIWAGSIGISINQRQELLQGDLEEWWMYCLSVVRLIAVPMVLHGLYDTLLKKQHDLLALAVAAASFGYLAWQISHLRHSDDEDDRAAYVAQYIRSRAAAGQA
jgi:RsiW-degrading membrane proteinase PrsW (M82 family)